jgi:hypothetical protein
MGARPEPDLEREERWPGEEYPRALCEVSWELRDTGETRLLRRRKRWQGWIHYKSLADEQHPFDGEVLTMSREYLPLREAPTRERLEEELARAEAKFFESKHHELLSERVQPSGAIIVYRGRLREAAR